MAAVFRGRPPSRPLAREARALVALRADQGRDTYDFNSRLPLVGEARHADSCIWSTGRVRLEVRRQHGTNGAFCFRGAFRGGVDRQAWHVGAHRAVVFGLELNGQTDPMVRLDNRLRLLPRGGKLLKVLAPSRPCGGVPNGDLDPLDCARPSLTVHSLFLG